MWPEVTFDDGHISNFEFALPILQSRAIRAWFFITVGWTGRRPGYMGWNELRKLHQAGHVIGAHGWTHTLLTHCSARRLHSELVDARLTLEDKLGASVTSMSLPGGRYNRHVLDRMPAGRLHADLYLYSKGRAKSSCADHRSAERPRRYDTGVDRQTLRTREPCSLRTGAAIPDEGDREVAAWRPVVRKALGDLQSKRAKYRRGGSCCT